jgi:predicted amidohydrolase YtcJ
MAGITADSKDPAGGVIRRKDGSQEPNGVLEESAFFNALAKILPSLGPEGFKAFAREGSKLWARFGYTTAQEGRATPQTIALLKSVADAGQMPIDVVAYADVLVDRDMIVKSQSKTYTNRFRIGGGKLTFDGSAPGFTGWRDKPYYKPVGDYPRNYMGYPAVTPDQVFESVAWAYANKVQLLSHANAERASDLLIAAHMAAQGRYGKMPELRPVLIHGQFLREDQVESFGKLGVIPSLFPMHTFYWGDWHMEHTLGPEDGPNISPTGWVLKRGMIFTSHNDAPVAFPDSMRVLDATVTRRARQWADRGAAAPGGRDHRVEGDDDLAGLPAFRRGDQGQHRNRQAGRFRHPVKGSDRGGTGHHRRHQGDRNHQGRPDGVPARTRQGEGGRWQ